jgi:hypothetical protein
MTSVPPEPPVGSGPQPPTPPAPPPGFPPVPPEQPTQQSSAPPPVQSPPGQRGVIDPASVKPMDWGIMAAGILALIFSRFDYYTATAKAAGHSAGHSISAWHGFFGWFATVLALAGAIVLALHIFAPEVQLGSPVRPIVLGAFLLSVLCLIIAGFVTPGARSSGEFSAAFGVQVSIDYGRGVGYFLSLIVILTGAVLSFLRLRETGGTLPWEKSRT